MFGYIYKTTNLINGKIYIGKRQKQEFDKYYLGSGIYLKKAIEKYGKENFSCEIIDECNSIEELNEREIYWIDKLNSRIKSIGYNISKGGDGGWYGVNLRPNYKRMIIVKSNKTRKISKKSKLKNSKSNKERWTPELRKEHGEKIHNYYSNSNLSEEELELRHRKISESHKGQKAWNKGLTKETDKRVAKYSKNLIGKNKGPNLKLSKSLRETDKNKNTKWMNNGIIEKIIKPEEINLYLKNNWKFGRIKKAKP